MLSEFVGCFLEDTDLNIASMENEEELYVYYLINASGAKFALSQQ